MREAVMTQQRMKSAGREPNEAGVEIFCVHVGSSGEKRRETSLTSPSPLLGNLLHNFPPNIIYILSAASWNLDLLQALSAKVRAIIRVI